jgi:hypothetical protein
MAKKTIHTDYQKELEGEEVMTSYWKAEKLNSEIKLFYLCLAQREIFFSAY